MQNGWLLLSQLFQFSLLKADGSVDFWLRDILTHK